MTLISTAKIASLSTAKKLVVTSAVAWMATSSSTVAMPVVPDRMIPSSTMKSMNWNEASLIPVDLTIGVQEQTPSLTGGQVIAKHTGSAGSIAFVVRRPG